MYIIVYNYDCTEYCWWLNVRVSEAIKINKKGRFLGAFSIM